jgi:hypothetical protein
MTVRRNLPATELARHACKDCGVNVIEIGEYYMVSPRLWEDKFHLTWTDNFCIGCLEARLGRKLQNLVVTPDLVIGGDFISFPKNPGGYENSARYTQRIMGDQVSAISKQKHGEPLPRGWKWKKVRGRWHATNGHQFIEEEPHDDSLRIGNK